MRVLGTKDQEHALLRAKALLGSVTRRWDPKAPENLKAQALPQPGGPWISPAGLVLHPRGGQNSSRTLCFLALTLCSC